jgi:lysophospholipase L1-like esterase
MTTIVCLGDSVTQGLGGNGVQHAESDRWPSVLAQATGAAVYNRGIGGETTAMALDRFHTQVAPLLPATVLIAFAINDCYVFPWRSGPRVGLAEFRRNLAELGAWTVRLGGTPVLIAPHRMAEQAHAQGNGATLAANLEPYAAAVVEVAAAHGWNAIDLRSALAPGDLDGDGVHLTPMGSRHYGAVVAAALNQRHNRQ